MSTAATAPPPAHEHLAEFYGADEQALISQVGTFLADGSRQKAGLLVIASQEHRAAIIQQLRKSGLDTDAAIRDGLLISLDAERIIRKVIVDGEPDWARFEAFITHTLAGFVGRTNFCVYGEMVGILWAQGKHSTAIRIEEFWNKALQSQPCRLLCGYPINVLDEGFEAAEVDAVVSLHTGIVSSSPDGALDDALNRAVADCLGVRFPEWGDSDAAEVLLRAKLPQAEAHIRALRTLFPGEASAILAKARDHHRNEKRFRSLIENSFDAIFLVDTESRIRYASSSTTRVLGYQPKDIVGQIGIGLVHPEDSEIAMAVLGKAVSERRGIAQTQVRVRKKDGTYIWIEGSVSNLLDEPEIEAIVVNYRDISQRKQAEAEILAASDRRARSEAQLQVFASAATHELRDSVRKVRVLTRLMIEGMKQDERGQEFGALVSEGFRGISALLEDVARFASIQFRGGGDPVPLNEALAEAVQSLSAMIDWSGAEIHAGALPLVAGTKALCVQLFHCLLENAIKFRSGEKPRIYVLAERLDRNHIIKVSDNGIGIAPEYHERIFDVFGRVHGNKYPGNGIGLAICRRLVDDLGGRVWVESNAEAGVTFCVALPEL